MFKNKHASGLIVPSDINKSKNHDTFSSDVLIISTSDLKGVRPRRLLPLEFSYIQEIDMKFFINEIKSVKPSDINCEDFISIKNKFKRNEFNSGWPNINQVNNINFLIKILNTFIYSTNPKTEMIINDKKKIYHEKIYR